MSVAVLSYFPPARSPAFPLTLHSASPAASCPPIFSSLPALCLSQRQHRRLPDLTRPPHRLLLQCFPMLRRLPFNPDLRLQKTTQPPPLHSPAFDALTPQHHPIQEASTVMPTSHHHSSQPSKSLPCQLLNSNGLFEAQPSILGPPPSTVMYAAGHYSQALRRSRRRRRKRIRRSKRPSQSSPRPTMSESDSLASTWTRRGLTTLPPAIGSPLYLQECSLLIGSIPIDLKPPAAHPAPCRRGSSKCAAEYPHCLSQTSTIPNLEWPSLQEAMVLLPARPSPHQRRINCGFTPHPHRNPNSHSLEQWLPRSPWHDCANTFVTPL